MSVLLASDYDKSKYLRAEDLKGPTKLRIKEMTEEVFNNKNTGKPEKKLVVWFTTIDQGLVLNKTNNRTIRGAFGDLIAGWKGKIIVVFPTTTDVGGKVTACLRVRIPPPKQAAAAPQQPVTSGNGATVPAPAGNGAAAVPLAVAAAAPLSVAAAVAAQAAADPELDPDPVKPIDDELDDDDMDDEIAF